MTPLTELCDLLGLAIAVIYVGSVALIVMAGGVVRAVAFGAVAACWGAL